MTFKIWPSSEKKPRSPKKLENTERASPLMLCQQKSRDNLFAPFLLAADTWKSEVSLCYIKSWVPCLSGAHQKYWLWYSAPSGMRVVSMGRGCVAIHLPPSHLKLQLAPLMGKEQKRTHRVEQSNLLKGKLANVASGHDPPQRPPSLRAKAQSKGTVCKGK